MAFSAASFLAHRQIFKFLMVYTLALGLAWFLSTSPDRFAHSSFRHALCYSHSRPFVCCGFPLDMLYIKKYKAARFYGIFIVDVIK